MKYYIVILLIKIPVRTAAFRTNNQATDLSYSFSPPSSLLHLSLISPSHFTFLPIHFSSVSLSFNQFSFHSIHLTLSYLSTQFYPTPQPDHLGTICPNLIQIGSRTWLTAIKGCLPRDCLAARSTMTLRPQQVDLSLSRTLPNAFGNETH